MSYLKEWLYKILTLFQTVLLFDLFWIFFFFSKRKIFNLHNKIVMLYGHMPSLVKQMNKWAVLLLQTIYYHWLVTILMILKDQIQFQKTMVCQYQQNPKEHVRDSTKMDIPELFWAMASFVEWVPSFEISYPEVDTHGILWIMVFLLSHKD